MTTLDEEGLLPFATAAVDLHRLTAEPCSLGRAELDALHAHITALYGLLDAHAKRTDSGSLRSARIRLWQTADHLHDAYHRTQPRPGGQLPLCRRHLATSARVRRDHTPTDLRMP